MWACTGFCHYRVYVLKWTHTHTCADFPSWTTSRVGIVDMQRVPAHRSLPLRITYEGFPRVSVHGMTQDSVSVQRRAAFASPSVEMVTHMLLEQGCALWTVRMSTCWRKAQTSVASPANKWDNSATCPPSAEPKGGTSMSITLSAELQGWQ